MRQPAIISSENTENLDPLALRPRLSAGLPHFIFVVRPEFVLF